MPRISTAFEAAGGGPSPTARFTGIESLPQELAPRESLVVKSALFIDVDNVLGVLAETNFDSAVLFAQEPAFWLDKLVGAGLPDGCRREFCTRRAYVNPKAYVPSPGSGSRLYFRDLMKTFSDAGIEVVQCDSIRGQKNGADITMAFHAALLLSSDPSVAELVIATGDSDFLGVLDGVAQLHRSASIIAPSRGKQTSVKLRDAAKLLIELEDLLQDAPATEPAPGVEVPSMRVSSSGAPRLTKTSAQELADEIRRVVSADSGGPMPLKSLVRKLPGDFANFNQRTVRRVIRNHITVFACTREYVWDRTRTVAPDAYRVERHLQPHRRDVAVIGHRVPICRPTGEPRYRDRKQCSDAIRAIRLRDCAELDLRASRCPECKGWHIERAVALDLEAQTAWADLWAAAA